MSTDTLADRFSLMCNICNCEKKYVLRKVLGPHFINFSPPPPMVVMELKNGRDFYPMAHSLNSERPGTVG